MIYFDIPVSESDLPILKWKMAIHPIEYLSVNFIGYDTQCPFRKAFWMTFDFALVIPNQGIQGQVSQAIDWLKSRKEAMQICRE